MGVVGEKLGSWNNNIMDSNGKGRETDNRQTDRQTDRETDRQTDRQTDRETERQTDRQTERVYI